MNFINGKRILLVDDEASVRDTLRFLLTSLGGEVTEAEDGAGALAHYRRGRFDVVITDYNMSHMRGDELAAAIKTLNPTQRIVMISGFPERVLRSGRRPDTVDAILAKPCRLEDLLAVLHENPGEVVA